MILPAVLICLTVAAPRAPRAAPSVNSSPGFTRDVSNGTTSFFSRLPSALNCAVSEGCGVRKAAGSWLTLVSLNTAPAVRYSDLSAWLDSLKKGLPADGAYHVTRRDRES